MKNLFLLDPKVVFLNHGSFGAVPRPVFEVFQEWQRRLERQPVQFLSRELIGLLRESRRELGRFLNADADDLVYVPNATHAINVVARSLELGPGDEVLSTDHEYGACNRVWGFLSSKQGFRFVRQPIPLPVSSPEEIVEQFWAGLTPRTRLIFISHITSNTALRMPVEAICRKARTAGILTFVDGAHAPGQIPLDLPAVDGDFYAGNCHKWMCAPKGAGFLYAQPAVQSLLEPLVVSWGWQSEMPGSSPFVDHHEWLGTNDPAAYLSVPAAIQFLEEHDWPAVRKRCQSLLRQALARIGELTGLRPVVPDDAGFYSQMAIAPLPDLEDPGAFKSRLYDDYFVEAPVLTWNDSVYIRLSVQGYNSQGDIDALIEALRELLA